MAIDIKAEVVINRSKEDVTSYAMNPDNDPVWITGIMEARMLTGPPLAKGTTVERVGVVIILIRS